MGFAPIARYIGQRWGEEVVATIEAAFHLDLIPSVRQFVWIIYKKFKTSKILFIL